jgi:hypothetical protein
VREEGLFEMGMIFRRRKGEGRIEEKNEYCYYSHV